MKLICTQENLIKALNVAEKIVGRNVNLPILNNILLETDDGQLKLSSTNLEIGLNYWTRGKIEKEGSLTVPAKIITNFVMNLPKKNIEMEVENETLSLKCENYKAKIKGMSAQEFPIIPKIKEEPLVILLAEEFKSAASRVISSTAISETRPEITGVFMKIEKDNLTLAATDSYRLAEKKIKLQKPVQESVLMIIPRTTMNELIYIIGENQGELKISISQNQILFNFNNINLVSRLIDGQYPDYQQIIPSSFKIKAIIKTAELKNAVKIAGFFTSTQVSGIKVKLDPPTNKIKVSAETGEIGASNSEVEAKIEGDSVEIIFNYKYILDALNNMLTDQVVLEMNDSSSPVLLKPEGNKNYLYLIMPIKTE
jgi:DNA polymerase-3 subunit beta